MERLVREGKLDAVIDLTTTEICDLITGGVMSAEPDRLEAAIQAGIPCVVSVVSLHPALCYTLSAFADIHAGRHRYEQLWTKGYSTRGI